MERHACSGGMGDLSSSSQTESREGEFGGGREAGEYAETAHVSAIVAECGAAT
jgi:hypothetical protein